MYLSFDFRGDRLYLYRKFPLYDKYLYLTKRLVAQAKKAQAYIYAWAFFVSFTAAQQGGSAQ